MCSKSNYRNCSNNVPARLDDDRFSDLPTCLIMKILSLLTTKDVVVTSALSTKWKQLWTSVANLDFDDTLMVTSEKKFMGIVSKVIVLHDKTYLQRFRLKCHKSYVGSLLNAWISNFVPCNLQELDLFVPLKCPVLLSSAIFLCKTLVILKLNVKGKVNMPTSTSLPNLRTLHLNGVEIRDDASLASLLNGCIVLEELKMSRCIGKNVRVVNVISRTLTNLTLLSLSYNGEKRPTTSVKYRIMLDTPSLQNIYVGAFLVEDCEVKKFNHLSKADINIGVSVSNLVVEGEVYNKALANLFKALSEVRTLKLSSYSMEAIGWFVFEVPRFSNLTKLEISTFDSFGSRRLATFLENSPCLETLDLLKMNSYRNIFFGLYHNNIMPSCFRSHLKLITIRGFVGAEEDMKMVKLFLKNAQVLEKLDLLRYPVYLSDVIDTDVLLKEILKFPKASSICRIELG